MNARDLSYGIRPASLKRGQIALSTVFIIGGLIVFASLLIAFLVLSFLNSSAGFQASNRAVAVASAGAYDALLLLDRGKDFPFLSPYTVPLGPYSATVTVTPNSPSTGQVTILSTATILTYVRRVQAIVSVTSSTGKLDLLSWKLL